MSLGKVNNTKEPDEGKPHPGSSQARVRLANNWPSCLDSTVNNAFLHECDALL